MEDLRKEIEEKATQLINKSESKSIEEVGLKDIKFELDHTKSYKDQAEDVVSAMATVKAVQDENVVQDITDKKAEELKEKADKHLKKAQAENLNAETDRQEAERKKYEAVLSTFGITKHLPNWLLKTMVILFSPMFIVLTIAIGVPCGVVKILIDNIDNILVRYESAETTNKPKIKTTIWIILIFLMVGVISLVVLKILGKI